MSKWQEASRFAGRVEWVGRFPADVTVPSHLRWAYHERLDEAAYRALLAESQALVYFSEYEGFGMPPVEAVLNGACPVYSALPATQEVMNGEGAAFENGSFDSFAAAMDRALEMPGSELVKLSERLQQRFSWSAVADRVIDGLKAHSGTP
jgi:glycosyltransferase involved in cell wall biosynthesis